MFMTEYETELTANVRYSVLVIGGDSVYLQDSKLGQRLYIGSATTLPRTELYKYIADLNNDLKQLSLNDFLTKHGFCDDIPSSASSILGGS